MGDVINLKDGAATKRGPKLRPEPKGYLLVPARALDMIAKIEASLVAFVASEAAHVIDYSSLYALMACVELSTRYK
jgi:hypothetical protein